MNNRDRKEKSEHEKRVQASRNAMYEDMIKDGKNIQVQEPYFLKGIREKLENENRIN